MLDDAALYSAARLEPDQSQRKLLDRLVPGIAKTRVHAATARGLEQGWLVERQGPRRARLFRTAEAHDLDSRMVELMVAALERAHVAGLHLGHEHRRRLMLVARGVVAKNGDL